MCPLKRTQSISEKCEKHLKKNTENEAITKKIRRGPRGGVAIPFPVKLYQVLENDEYSDIISWQSHGRCFVLHNQRDFLEKVIQIFFKQTKLTSFQRQLNLYGFRRISNGPDKGGYYHYHFLRGKPSLCRQMLRMKIKGDGISTAPCSKIDPDFYRMPPLRKDEELSQSFHSRKSCVKVESSIPRLLKKSSLLLKNISSSSMYDCLDEDRSTLKNPAMISPPTSPDVSPLRTHYIPERSLSILELNSTIKYNTECVPRSMPCSRENESKSKDDFGSLSRCIPFEQNRSSVSKNGDILLFEGKKFHYLDSSFMQ